MLHNLAVVAIDRGEFDAAEAFAQAAFERYIPNHPKLPALAYDTAYLWLSRGHAGRALHVFQSLLSHFPDPCARVQVLCATGKAAGLIGARDLFASCAAKVGEITRGVQLSNSPAAALVDLGVGALALGENDLAESLLTEAFVLARERGSSDTLIKVDQALDQLRRGGRVLERRPSSNLKQPQEELAGRIAMALDALAPAGCV